MTSEDYWGRIREYYGATIHYGEYDLRKNFEVYVSPNGELAWSAIRPGHIEHLNPQGIQVGSITESDIGRMLSQIAEFQLKKPPVDADTMVKHNAGLVARIMNDIKAKKDTSATPSRVTTSN